MRLRANRDYFLRDAYTEDDNSPTSTPPLLLEVGIADNPFSMFGYPPWVTIEGAIQNNGISICSNERGALSLIL